MIEVHVREDHVIDLLRRYASRRKRGENPRHRRRGRAVDDYRASLVDDQMHRRLHLTVVDRVDGGDAMLVVQDTFHRRIIESAP